MTINNERMVTRTITTTFINYLYFDLEAMKTDEGMIAETGKKLTIEEAEKAMSKRNIGDNKKFLKVTGVSYDEDLYGVSEEDFMYYGSTTYDRTERMVTRTIKSTVIKSLYFDLDTMGTVYDDFIITGKELSLEEAEKVMNKGKYEGSRKFLKVVDVHTTFTNYGMTESFFKTIARYIDRA